MNGMDIAGGAEYRLDLEDNLSKALKKATDQAVRELNTIGPAVAKVTQQVSGAIKGLTAEVDNAIKSYGKTVSKIGAGVAGIGVGITATGAASSYALLRTADDAAKLEETLDKFETVFKEQSDATRDWARQFSSDIKASEQRYLSFLAQAQDSFVPLGIDRAEAAELSKTIVRLAADLSSFNPEVSEMEAFNRVLKGVLGNTENLKAFGVQASAAEVRAKALAKGFDPRNLTASQKALTILDIVIQGTADAAGHAAANADKYAASQRGLTAEVDRFKSLLGQPVKDALASVNNLLGETLGKVNDLLDRFPSLSKVAVAAAASLTGIGVGITAAGGALARYGILLNGMGILAASHLIKAHGLVGALQLALNRTQVSIARLLQGFGNLGSLKPPPINVGVTATGAGSITGGITGAIKSAVSLIVSSFKNGARLTGPIILQSVKGIGSILSKAITGVVGRLGAVFLAGFGGVKVGEAIGVGFYDYMLRKAKSIGNALDVERVKIVGQSFRDAGQEAPADLFKTLKDALENNRLAVVKPKPIELSDEERELGLEINNAITPLEAFQQSLRRAKKLLDAGEITRAQFDRFTAEKTEDFTRPQVEERQSALEALQTPLETFRMAIAKARKVFATDPVMFKRAEQAAIEQFRASDRATQMAISLRTPLEQYRAAIALARDVFANSPVMMRRAMNAATDEFRRASPAEQIRRSLMTPLELFRERMREVARGLQGVPDAMRNALLRRAVVKGKKNLAAQDPVQQFAQRVKDGLRNAGDRIVDEMAQVAVAVKAGALTIEEGKARFNQLVKDQLGPRPNPGERIKAFGTTNAFVAANLNRFAPTFDADAETLQYEKKQVELQEQMADALKRIQEEGAPAFQ